MSPPLKDGVKLLINFLINLIPIVGSLSGIPGLGLVAGWLVSKLAGWLTDLIDYAVRKAIISKQVGDAISSAKELGQAIEQEGVKSDRVQRAFEKFKSDRSKLRNFFD